MPPEVSLLVTHGFTSGSEYLVDHFAMNIGQAKIPAGVSERQFLVIETKTMQHRRMQIMNTGRFIDSLEIQYRRLLRRPCRP
jgi:hypothetical protein